MSLFALFFGVVSLVGFILYVSFDNEIYLHLFGIAAIVFMIVALTNPMTPL